MNKRLNTKAYHFLSKNLRRLFMVALTLTIISCSSEPSSTPETENTQNNATSPLAPNTWQKYADGSGTEWRRVRHGGVAFDSKRQKLYFFGSDTHDTEPYNLDNAIHEFDLATKKWLTHYDPAPLYTYRTDREGYAIAGLTDIQPWAMHTFDNILYDPVSDAIIVTATPEQHNHLARKAVPAVKQHPTWSYDLKTQKWKIITNNGKPSPTFFAAASAYDTNRQTTVAYDKSGLWELSSETKTWQQASKKRHHEIHFTMEYDELNQLFAVFGNYRGSSDIWIYKPTNQLNERWEKRIPKGANLPASEHYPVVYDSTRNTFLLVINTPQKNRASQKLGQKPAPDSAQTFIYNAKTNQLQQLPNASLDLIEMNYTMVYSELHDTFYLVTGSDKKSLAVWALKLQLNQNENISH